MELNPATTALCSRCGVTPRLSGQRWRRSCRATTQRERRAKSRAVNNSHAVTQSNQSGLQGLTPFAIISKYELRGVTRSDLRTLICGYGAPAEFPSGCGLPFENRRLWRPFYCRNGCGSRRSEHDLDCPTREYSTQVATISAVC